MAPVLEDVAAKVEAGDRLTDEDIQTLASARDIVRLGMLADSVRRKIHGSNVTFVRVFDLSLEQAANRDTSMAVPAGAGEVRILETPPSLAEAVSLVTSARELAGAVPLSAFSLFQLNQFPEGLPVALAALKAAGLEIVSHAPLDRLLTPEDTLEAVTDAGLTLARLTIADTPARDWTAVCREVSAHQRRLQSIRAFAPLPRTIDVTQPTTGYADVKRVALARILIQNVDSIQVDWALYGPKLAQVALTFGADDLDSVSAADGGLGQRRSTLEDVRRGIQAASLVPVERDARFQSV